MWHGTGRLTLELQTRFQSPDNLRHHSRLEEPPPGRIQSPQLWRLCPVVDAQWLDLHTCQFSLSTDFYCTLAERSCEKPLTHIILTDMYTFSTNGESYINAIINHQGDPILSRNLVQLACHTNKIASIAGLIPVLDDCNSCLTD